MNKRQIIGLAAFIYLFLAPFTYHPDIKTIFYQSQFLSQGVFNIYSFFAQNPGSAFLGPFVYPPLAYFIYGILFIPVKIIAGFGFSQWLGMGNDAVGVTHIFQYLFAIKLPAIIFHFLTAFILMKFLSDEKEQNKILLLWFFNPISIYVIAFMGQIDGLAVFLTVLAFYLAKRRSVLATVSLGLAAAIKTYPLLLLPFLAVYIGKTWRKRLVHIGFGLVAYTVFILPFVTTPSFYTSTLASGLSQRIFELKLYLGFGENILIVPAILIAILLFVASGRIENRRIFSNYFLVITFLTVVLTHFHPQWGLWFLPFLITSFMNIKKDISIWSALILLFLGWFGTILLFDDKFLSWGILSPIDPGILFLPTFAELIKRVFDPLLIQSLFHTILISSGGYLIWRSFKDKK